MRCVAALPSIALLAGCAIGLLLPAPPYLTGCGAMAAAVLVALWACYAGRPWTLSAAVVCGFFAGGALLAAVEWQRAWRPPLRVAFESLAQTERTAAEREGRRLPLDDQAFATITGTLRSDAAATDNGASLSLAVHSLEREGSREREGSVEREGFSRATLGGVQLTVTGALAAERISGWRAGRRLRMPVLLRRPTRYLDPGVPDNERALAQRGTTLVGSVKSGALVEVIEPAGWWTEQLSAIRAFARRSIEANVGRWNPQSAAIVAAIVIGDRTAIDPEVVRRLQDAGTYHVIAISGGNIAILAGVLVAALRVAGWLGRSAMIATIVLLVAYAGLVGGGASVDRATLMAVVHFGARAFDQRSPPLNVLAVTAAVLIASNPLSITDPGFLLTFGATLAIIVVIPAVDFSRLVRPVRVAATLFLASVAAEAVLFPVGAVLFSRITFAGLALNFAAIPMMAVAQVAGMIVVPASLASRDVASGVGWFAHLGASGLVASADLVRFAPALVWRVAPPVVALCAMYYSALLTAWGGWRGRDRLGSAEPRRAGQIRIVSTTAAIVFALSILTDPRTLAARAGDGRLHATFLDVGQGDAIFVVFPRGSTLLVDAGGLGFSSSFDIGDRVVAPVIRAAGFRRIDRLAVTHGDPDHVGGALAIVREFRPREVWEGIPVPRSETLTRLRMEAQAAGAQWSNVYAGDHTVIDEVTVTALHPGRADWERQRVRNDDSLVLELRWRDVSLVLTGDIGRIPEARVAAEIRPARVRVVKIPHHGSLTSSTPGFVRALRPQIAVVSAGRSNHFGHPVPEVLARYEQIGADVYRTDRDGAVMLDTDGYNITRRRFAEEVLR